MGPSTPPLANHDKRHVSGYSTRPQLPNELLHAILGRSIADGLHTLCTRDDTSWEMNMLVTFHCVSFSFRAVSREIVSKGFNIPFYDVDDDETSYLRTTRKISSCLHQLGVQQRHSKGSFTTGHHFSETMADCYVSPLFLSYGLYINGLSLRTSALSSNAQRFLKIQPDVVSTLGEASDLCKQVNPRHIADHLAMCVEGELESARSGLALVEAFDYLAERIIMLNVFQSSASTFGGGPIAAVHELLNRTLSKIEEFSDENSQLFEASSLLKATQLPGISRALDLADACDLKEDRYRLAERCDSISRKWKDI
ncbi:hypothetical protein FA15DRAFT_586672 [Coprinopsis marcescibilis]|uniref:Uncharacterized protein n=1 Tax=Coprinopsis marcescibilis TaxID=230819 RepID=A0A5C3L2I4_COPMA|nr:hypothetical protein FA15DRAFT_586672 [Coprinopsis marcescibilis]